jgi:uncharacterized membrane protein YdjX (TVP38/TMEM64 family)
VPQGAEPLESRTRVRLIWIAIAAAVGLSLWLTGRSLGPRVLALMADVDRLGPAAPIGFIIIYAVGILALLPSTVLTIAAGALFGIVSGVIYAFIGATIGSTCAFLIGRHGGRRFVEQRLARMPRFAAVERAAARQGRRIVFLLRLSPVVPFNFLNYALGLTTMSVWDFIVAGFGSLPGEVMYAYWGRLSGEALALAEETAAPRTASYYAFLVAGLLATLAATALVTRTARRALRDV